MLTVAARDIAPAWREQLVPETGRLVLPLILRGPQRSVAFVNTPAGLVSADVRGCSFMQLRGLLATEPQQVPLEPGGLARDHPASRRCATHRHRDRGGIPGRVAAAHADGRHAANRARSRGARAVARGARSRCELRAVVGARPASPLPRPVAVHPSGFERTLGLVDASRRRRARVVLQRRTAERAVRCARPRHADALAELVACSMSSAGGRGRPTERCRSPLSVRTRQRCQSRSPKPARFVMEQRWTRFLLRSSRPPPPPPPYAPPPPGRNLAAGDLDACSRAFRARL